MLVYIDVHGIGRKALLRKAGRSFVRAKVRGREVILAPDIKEGNSMGNDAVVLNAVSTFGGPGSTKSIAEKK